MNNVIRKVLVSMGARKLLRSRIAVYGLIPWRCFYALSYYWPKILRIPMWLFRSREIGNFTYEVTDSSRTYTAAVVSLVTNVDWRTAEQYLSEFYEDAAEIQGHVEKYGKSMPDRYTSDMGAKPGRRIIYYLLVRALKPRLVVESGVARGLGTCIIGAALRRNKADGFPGRVLAIDFNPSAGGLFLSPYSDYGTLVHRDVLEVLANQINSRIDLYIHDTTPDPNFEISEFGLVEPLLAPNSILVSVWHTERLMDFARRSKRRYVMFQDEPSDHWYPGSRMGLVFSDKTSEA
jgi:predicted O-methyltransferase YrrM